MPIVQLLLSLTLALTIPQDCTTWQECRDGATAAAARQDFEAFHDLAWRAVQRGPKNDPALMLMLARAQSLSGRPGDALVMIERLVSMGVPTDAASSEDFRRVRALPRWGELERRIAGMPDTAVPPPAPVETKTETKAAPAAVPSKDSEKPASAEAMRYSAPGLAPNALAYDRVSRRFLVADRDSRKLVVVDEFSRNVATFAGAQAGFGDIDAIEIDPRVGDLWVVSSALASEGNATTLHKLQLISGRVLATFTLRPQSTPARFVDVAVSPAAGVLVLDGLGNRAFRVRGTTLELVGPAPEGATGLAATDNGSLYVAARSGVWRMSGGTVLPVVMPAGADVQNITRLRYHRGSLVALCQIGGAAHLVRLRLDGSGRTISAVEKIDVLEPQAGAFAIVDDAVVYHAGGAGTSETTLRRLPLKDKRR